MKKQVLSSLILMRSKMITLTIQSNLHCHITSHCTRHGVGSWGSVFCGWVPCYMDSQQTMNKPNPPYYQLYSNYLDVMLEKTGKLSAIPTSAEDLFIKSCALRIFTNAKPICDLLLDERYDQASMILRNSLEAYASLLAVINEKSFFKPL